jgi:hypothetical protein
MTLGKTLRFAVFVASITLLGMASWRYSSESDGIETPNLVCEQAIYSFGEKFVGDRVGNVFLVRNVSRHPVKIERVASSCSCTDGELPSITEVIPSGGSLEIPIKMRVTAPFGPQKKAFFVQTSSPNQSLRLEFEGICHSSFDVNPPEIKLGNGSSLDKGFVNLDILARRKGNAVIASVRSNFPEIEAIHETVEPGRHFRLRVRQTRDIPVARPFAGKVNVIFLNSDESSLTIPVELGTGS